MITTLLTALRELRDNNPEASHITNSDGEVKLLEDVIVELELETVSLGTMKEGHWETQDGRVFSRDFPACVFTLVPPPRQ